MTYLLIFISEIATATARGRDWSRETCPIRPGTCSTFWNSQLDPGWILHSENFVVYVVTVVSSLLVLDHWPAERRWRHQRVEPSRIMSGWFQFCSSDNVNILRPKSSSWFYKNSQMKKPNGTFRENVTETSFCVKCVCVWCSAYSNSEASARLSEKAPPSDCFWP